MTQKQFIQKLNSLIEDSEKKFKNWLSKNDSQKVKSIAMLLIYADKNFHYHLANIASCSKSKLNAQLALQNLKDETRENHPRLGKEFARLLKIDLNRFRKTLQTHIDEVDKSIENKNNSIFMSGFMAATEACSPLMMRAMMSFAKTRGVKSSRYILKHSGELELKHAKMLLKGLSDEVESSKSNYSEAYQGLKAWQNLMNYIFDLKQF